MDLQPFHLAVQVRDIAEAREFYKGLLGCAEGRSDESWVDFNLFGHQFVCHLNPTLGAEGRIQSHFNPVDSHSVPVPHFGVVLTMDDWELLAQRLTAAGQPFIIEPVIRFRGRPGEQGTLFIQDPAGNSLEFKGFKEMGQLFAR